MGHSIYQGFIGFELFNIKEFVLRTEEFFEKELSALEKSFEEQSQKYSVNDVSEFYENMFENEIYNYSDSFPELFRKSVFISVYSVLEKYLEQLCFKLKEKNSIELSPTDLNGKGIERSKKYLTKILKVNLPLNSTEWELINKYNKIRNYFSHDEQLIQKDTTDAKLRDLIYCVRSICSLRLEESTIPGYYEVKLEKDFCLEVIRTVQLFFNKIKVDV